MRQLSDKTHKQPSATSSAIIAPDDDGARVDRWFKRHHPGIGHGMVERLLRTGQIRLDGKKVKAADRVAAGQTMRLPPQITLAPVLEAKPAPVKTERDDALIRGIVIHQDKSVIVLNKPSGLATQGGTGQVKHIDGLLDALSQGSKKRPKLVHRLDRDTSGVLVVARTVPPPRWGKRCANATHRRFMGRGRAACPSRIAGPSSWRWQRKAGMARMAATKR